MPKPVLSDSLFNADDVATAVLNEADLQIASSDLGVTDISSSFIRGSNNSSYQNDTQCFLFMGFVFYSLAGQFSSTPSDGEVFFSINNSNYYPAVQYHGTSITYQGDVVNYIRIKTNGDLYDYI